MPDREARNFEIGLMNLVSGLLVDTGALPVETGALLVARLVEVSCLVVLLAAVDFALARRACFASSHFRNKRADICFHTVRKS